MVEFTASSEGYTGTFKATRGVALEPCGDLVMADTSNRRMVTVRDALPRCKTWLPLTVRSGGAE